ncbi:hypothetical protein [Paenibacillus brasilensis]|uniref:YopX protein domain-containing protein n=1 Tax=Paenibacillus brasilensis TaxID=128574 RepID=A0ABU0L4X4_9BACL|nr:hypothetical protein [Paenibacillus brasilensis]MDQ0496353.1 hypothetical protein [Paenibacillus brasilensis]
MREIKFRGKRLDNGEWFHGYLIGEDVIVGEKWSGIVNIFVRNFGGKSILKQ